MHNTQDIAELPTPTTSGLCRIQPHDQGLALVNPGMGWIFFHYDNSIEKYGNILEPHDTLDEFPGLSTVYLRLAWAFIEPHEGEFNWSIVDGPAQRYMAKGREVHLRFSCCESSLPYATPEWVREAGAKGHSFNPGKGLSPEGKNWEPDFNDPIFLEKLNLFLAAAAARYDDEPLVTAVDIGSFGVWGEGHTFCSTKIPYDGAMIKRHIELHQRHFKKTLLVANDDFSAHGRGEEIIHEAARMGLTLRDDSILVEPGDRIYHSSHLAQEFWPRLPVILESEHYGPSAARGVWGDGSGYLRAVEDYHASYAGIHWYGREFLEKNESLVEQINRRLGYRLQLCEAAWPAEVSVQGTFIFEAHWRNAGVAPCLRGGHVALTLKDSAGGIVTVYVDEAFNVRDLQIGLPDMAPIVERSSIFRLAADVRPGFYDLLVSVGSRTGSPFYELPLENTDGQKRYALGKIRITEILLNAPYAS